MGLFRWRSILRPKDAIENKIFRRKDRHFLVALYPAKCGGGVPVAAFGRFPDKRNALCPVFSYAKPVIITCTQIALRLRVVLFGGK